MFMLRIPQQRTQYSFLTPDQNDIMEVLDCIKVSEVLLIIWPIKTDLSEDNKKLLTICSMQGLPVMLHLAVGVSHNGKLRDQMRKIIEKTMSYWYIFKIFIIKFI